MMKISDYRDDADQQRVAQADQAAHQQVAAELVGAERMRPAPFSPRNSGGRNLSLTTILVALIDDNLGIDRRHQQQRR